MANTLGDDQRQQILALGRLGWPLRRIEQATGIRRETASAYLKAAGIAIRAPRRRRAPPNPASQVSTGLAKPASEVSTDFGVGSPSPAGLPPWPNLHGFGIRVLRFHGVTWVLSDYGDEAGPRYSRAS
jgi:hypothetical protein